MPDFDFIVGGIEDGMLALLKFLYGVREDNPNGYLKDAGSYAGELDEKSLKNAVESLSGNLPLMLVAYGEGVDKQSPATSSVLGEPRVWEHTCTFTVMALDNNARSEAEQRRGAVGDVGVYKMVADIWSALAGVRFAWRPPAGDDPAKVVVQVPNRRKVDSDIALNLEPFQLDGIDYLARLEGLTAYAVHFKTYFKWTEPDRRAAGTAVEELVFDVTSLNNETSPGELPGVILK